MMNRTIPSSSGKQRKVKLKSLNELSAADKTDYKKILDEKHRRDRAPAGASRSPPKRVS